MTNYNQEECNIFGPYGNTGSAPCNGGFDWRKGKLAKELNGNVVNFAVNNDAELKNGVEILEKDESFVSAENRSGEVYSKDSIEVRTSVKNNGHLSENGANLKGGVDLDSVIFGYVLGLGVKEHVIMI
tara:strand:- start:102 stop:485 length:384 start_codon:yes stop_codon:yes gene_type:complete